MLSDDKKDNKNRSNNTLNMEGVLKYVRTYLDFTSGGHMWAHAQVYEGTALVDCSHSALRNLLCNKTHLKKWDKRKNERGKRKEE